MRGYRIGEVAERVGMTVEGLRYYERRGLLPDPPRSRSGYRLYRESHLERLQFVKAAQEMGFTLEEIKALLELRQGTGPSCAAVKEQLEAKLRDVRRRIELLRGFEVDLEAAVDRCGEQLEDDETSACPVLAELGRSLPTGGADA